MMRFYLLILAACTMLCGCAASLDLSLKGIRVVPSGHECRLPISIGVDTLVDRRPQQHGEDNKKWLGFIPGTLWLQIDSDVPELYTSCAAYNSRPFNKTVTEGIGDALARSGMVHDTVFLPDDQGREIDYRLEGDLLQSLVQETSYYYGSWMYVWLFRMLSFPYVSYDFQLALDLRLRRMKDGRVIWTGRVQGSSRDKFHTVYTLAGGTEGKHAIAYNFSKILASQLPGVFKAMRAELEHDNAAGLAFYNQQE